MFAAFAPGFAVLLATLTRATLLLIRQRYIQIYQIRHLFLTATLQHCNKVTWTRSPGAFTNVAVCCSAATLQQTLGLAKGAP